MVEVELKFSVDDLASVRDTLVALGAKGFQSNDETDDYLDHPLHGCAKNDIALRLRRSDGYSWLTYKGPNRDRAALVREEYEVVLGRARSAAHENADQLCSILAALGFRSVAKVRKRRTQCDLDYRTRVIHICLDEVDGLGEFVELEYVILNQEENVDDIKAELMALAESLSLGQPITESFSNCNNNSRTSFNPQIGHFALHRDRADHGVQPVW